jgi:hypothetical protein
VWAASGILVAAVTTASADVCPRQIISLNGTWQVTEGTLDSKPAHFASQVPVPGLLDMAHPAFVAVGQKCSRRQAFWYRRIFRVEGPLPEAAWLKIHKACYGTHAWLNGHDLGEHLPCFTPGWFNARAALRGDGADNEIIVRVGADRSMLPKDMPTGFDFEKRLYLPGIYDSVELILSGAPRIVNVQVVPDIGQKQVRVLAEAEAGVKDCKVAVSGFVTEVRSKKEVGRTLASPVHLAARGNARVDFVIPISCCRLWSPEDPFLYEAHVSTGSDAVNVRFSMRTFRFDPLTKRAVLNGKPYYLRGSNVTLYRFFEDADRGGLPWREAWVRALHRKFKTMHWNALRYCIGFPPEFWYDIADEEGFLIQDEFPVWLLHNKAYLGGEPPEPVTAKRLIPEYTEWMRERWNHPCVVIWDAQNESQTTETGKALKAVRHLDRSNRPWENGWDEPQSPGDCVEAHPYLFSRDWGVGKNTFHMSEMPKVPLAPSRYYETPQRRSAPVVINEYGWLWLNRKGEPTTVCQAVYRNLLGPHATADQRRKLWARYLAALTEFWRAHRQAAGVLHFCSLGYSRRSDVPQPEGGATSDHWQDVARLQWQPFFEEYVRDAFNPVGVMLDFWAEQLPLGSRQTVKVYLINDLYRDWHGEVRLKLLSAGKTVHVQTKIVTVPGLGQKILDFPLPASPSVGDFELVAELAGTGAEGVRSRREFRVVADAPAAEAASRREVVAVLSLSPAPTSWMDERWRREWFTGWTDG